MNDNGKIDILLPYAEPVKWVYKDYCSGFPEFDDVLTDAYDCGNDVVALYYGNAPKGSLEAYTSLAEADGYEMTASYTAGSEGFATLESKSDNVRLYLSEGKDGFRITAESAQTITFPEKIERDNATTDITFTQMKLNYAATGGSTNGMSYVLQLEDGSYVIWDGGWANDAHTLNSYLKQNVPTGTIPHIRMWIFTHLHGDHSGCFLEFAQSYGASVKLDYVGFNSPTIYSDPEGDSIFTNGKLMNAISKFKSAVAVKLHTGMVLKMPGADIEVLLTHEDLGTMNIMSDYRNDQSVVTRIIVKDKKILLPGDAQTTAGEYIVGRYGSYLKSDYVQVAHHGSINHPTTLEFYKVSAPSYVFFPGAQSRFNENKNTEENAYLVKLVGISNIYVADGTDKRIKLN
jgi:beta-lactamase superfamily II metal-dependent hydrolase